MQITNICGEEYYRVDNVYEFIALCNNKKKCIFCMEFFELKGEQVVPCEYLQSIDSAELFDEKNSVNKNVELCNDFVKKCIDKCYNKMEGMYFSVLLE